MLVLQRQEGEKIICRIEDIEALKNGDEIVIDIAAVRGNRIKVGVEAPLAIRILRAELADDSNFGNRRDKLPISPNA